MKCTLLALVLIMLTLFTLGGCGSLSHPVISDDREHRQGADAASFQQLYGKYCSGCHGADGRNGAATVLANPLYLSWIDDNSLRDVISKGQQGSMMPGFAKASGGELTEQQVEALLKGMRQSWQQNTPALNSPSYKSSNAGDVERGRQLYSAICARCHGRESGPPGPKGSVLNGSFLGLVSNQMLRTTVVAGRPDLGMPDFRNLRPGRALTDQEITDIVAFVVSHRPATPGEPYPQHASATTAGAQPKP